MPQPTTKKRLPRKPNVLPKKKKITLTNMPQPTTNNLEGCCKCKDSHISCPKGIETAICAYCKKPPYSVWKMLKDKLKFIRCPECGSPNIKFKNNKSVGHYSLCILK